jgi:argininosuccinate lyase
MVESWIRSAGEALPATIRDRGHRYVLLAADPQRYENHPALTLADEVAVADTNDPTAVTAAAHVLHARQPFDGVLTTCDYYLEAAAVIAEELGLPGPAPAAVRLAVRKDLVREALTRAGLPNPRFATATSAGDARRAAAGLGYPLVAKPVDLNSSTLVRKVADERELWDSFQEIAAVDHNTRGQRRVPRVLLEELLVGPEVSVEAVTHRGATTVLGITDKSTTGVVESGHQFPAALAPEVELEVAEFVRAALVAIGWSHGISHTEVMLTPEGPRIVEINPRQGGNLIFELVRLVTGASTLDGLVDLALDQPLSHGSRDDAGRPASAAVFFVMSPRDGRVESVTGVDSLGTDPRVERWSLPTPVDVRRPVDNEDYAGHVLAVDPDRRCARAHAERAVARLRLCFSDGGTAAPFGLAAPAAV